MKRFLVLICFTACALNAFAQAPAVLNAAEIREGIQKLGVNASVLYIAAHPDDENTRLLAYLAGERKYRTGYLSITRGDGGQNLIGDEQGVELGMIRTQELLAARRIDGAEQFFTRAFDFGFSKSTEEALRIWNKELILADVVWVIRKFRPDVIITRFPPDNRAGHGHHSASAVLAREAFDAAADPTRFTEHFKHGVQPWKAKRLLWNTFNFGSTNTTSPDQFKIDVGIYNPMLGKSYGEIASESRSMHKSQGFGVPRQRGQSFEYFTLTAGDAMQSDIMDGVVTQWKRYNAEAIQQMADALLSSYQPSDPAASVKGLAAMYNALEKLNDEVWKKQKQEEVKRLLEACTGVWLEASTPQSFAVNEDSLSVNFNAIARMQVPVKLLRVQLDSCEMLNHNQQNSMQADCALQVYHVDTLINKHLPTNISITFNRRIKVNRRVSDPYWLAKPMTTGSFQVSDQQMIGKPWNDPVYNAVFTLEIEGTSFRFIKPVQYKFTDPVRGELYQPIVVYPTVSVKPNQSVLVFADTVSKKLNIQFTGHSRVANNGWANFPIKGNWMMRPEAFELKLPYNGVVNKTVQVSPLRKVQETGTYLQPTLAPSFGGIGGLLSGVTGTAGA
ncbi:MAG: PIG-L family deacetylase, partial [Chitinophagaceae bacterium]